MFFPNTYYRQKVYIKYSVSRYTITYSNNLGKPLRALKGRKGSNFSFFLPGTSYNVYSYNMIHYEECAMTIIVDDAGVGDLLFGVVIGAFRGETREFFYDILDVNYFRPPRFNRKEYLKQASKVVFKLLRRLQLKPDEPVHICRSYIFDEAIKDLTKKFGNQRVSRIKVTGTPQYLTETAYLDEIRNLGYRPLKEREKKRAKSFFHMMNWLKKNPDKLKYAKTGWPRLSRYHLFRSNHKSQSEQRKK